MADAKPSIARIASLDQFRGYTVAGMFLVNFVGGFAVTPIVLTHRNTFCSYADTIMPSFFFAVGFAFRLTFGRRAKSDGLASAYLHVVRRLLGLMLVAIVIYKAPTAAKTWHELVERGAWDVFKGSFKDWFQTLMHIAVTSLWILPVIRSGPLVRIAYMIASALAQVLLSQWFYFDWVQKNGIDGGILGFLMWSLPTIVGTLACDAVTPADGRPRVAKMIAWSIAIMGLGYLFSCPTTLYNVADDEVASLAGEQFAPDPVVPSSARLDTHAITWAEPPFVPPPDKSLRKENYWMMSQRRHAVVSHLWRGLFAGGLWALFYILCDLWGLRVGVFRTLGTNALVGYILHGIVGDSVEKFIPKDSPGWYVTAGFLLYFGITYLFIRHLEKSNIYLKLQRLGRANARQRLAFFAACAMGVRALRAARISIDGIADFNAGAPGNRLFAHAHFLVLRVSRRALCALHFAVDGPVCFSQSARIE